MMNIKYWIVCFVTTIITGMDSFGSMYPAHDNPSNTPKKTILSGFIPHHENSNHKIILRIWDHLNLIKTSQEYTTETENGHFKFELVVEKLEQMALAIDSDDNYYLQNFFGSMLIHIEPGDSLVVQIPSLDSVQISQTTFSGKGYEKQLVRKEIFEKVSEISFKKDSPKTVLEQSIENNITLRKVLLSSLEDEKERISQDAYNMLQRELLTVLYHSAAELFFNADLSDSKVRKTYQNLYRSNFPIDTDLLLNESNSVGSLYWKTVLQKDALLNYLVKNNLAYSSNFKKNLTLQYQILKETYGKFPIIDELLASFIVQRAKHKGWGADIDSIAKDYYKNVSQVGLYKDQVEEIELIYHQNLSRGSVAFNFALPDTSQRIVSLDQFLGNVVLLDFMYYGCAGCAFMAPELDEMEALFKDSKMVFISISVDRTSDQLKKSIGKFASKNSIHLYTNGESYDHEVIQRYQVNAYPTLVLIDRKGKIVTARAPDPRKQDSKSKLIALIQDNLKGL